MKWPSRISFYTLGNELNSDFMALKLIKDESFLTSDAPEFQELKAFSEKLDQDLVFEWKNGQFWLHSDKKEENPIGIEIDQELSRHEDFFKKSSLQKELLAKAIGVKGPFRPRVLDLTAGLLGDTLMMLAFGSEVVAVERHPVVRFLIQSALQNAHHPKLKNLRFEASDALSFLEKKESFDTIYFDPMFEDANVKASPRKEMRIFRNVVGKDQDAIEVLSKARAYGARRLVVKRPRQSADLGLKPDLQYIGKSTRYDVYFSL